VVDYGLLTKRFLDCLKSSVNLASHFTSQIKAIIVDEFQDCFEHDFRDGDSQERKKDRAEMR